MTTLAMEAVSERTGAARAPYGSRTGASDGARAQSRSPYSQEFLVRDARNVEHRVLAGELEWVDAQGNYLRFHAGGRTYLVREPMKHFEEKLDPARFARLNRSVIVNLAFVARVEPAERGEYRVVLRDRTCVTTSRAFGERFREGLR